MGDARLTLDPKGCVVTTVLPAGEGRVAQGSAGADIALGGPEGLVGVAVAVERSGTVVVLVRMRLTSPALRCAFSEVCRSPRRRGGFQQGGRGFRFGEGGAHCCGCGLVGPGGSLIDIARRLASIVDPC